jgi:hypothetical protein
MGLYLDSYCRKQTGVVAFARVEDYLRSDAIPADSINEHQSAAGRMSIHAALDRLAKWTEGLGYICLQLLIVWNLEAVEPQSASASTI